MSATVNTELNELLKGWLPQQRWFGGKGRAISAVEIESSAVLHEEAENDVVVRHVILRVDAEDGDTDRYQMLVGSRTGDIPARLQNAVIGDADGATVYEAVHDAEATAELLHRIVAGDDTATVRFTTVSDELDPSLPSRVMGAEQSNTSIVYGEDYILKVFRRLQTGLNPDLEVTRALAEAGSTHVAPPLAWLEGDVNGEATTLGMMQCFLRNASEGWAMATASVRDLFAEGDLHADEVGGDFAGESERLGVATAEVHALMAKTLPSRAAGPDDSQATARQLHERLDAALAIVAELAPYADRVRVIYDGVAGIVDPVPIQRIHGDLHLGQVLRTQDGWVLLDFEGEPARALEERTALMSPLRDVAGMLRSFDYASRHLLAERPGEQHLAYRAAEWAERNRTAFCDGYASAAGSDPREASVLLRAFELDKAVYEVVYEARNRPSWLPIPLGSIERLVEASA
ncbi:MAG: maltokinase [Actinomycetota bacterium]|jgi:maltokinase|nr:maltokinase [Actinomycetota bacterium]